MRIKAEQGRSPPERIVRKVGLNSEAGCSAAAGGARGWARDRAGREGSYLLRCCGCTSSNVRS